VGGGRLTGLGVDQGGHLYATSPQSGVVRKLTSTLEPLAELAGLSAPKDFFVPFVRTEDHRNGRTEWSGHGTAVVVEEWTRESGLRLFDLGVDVEGLRASAASGAIEARFRLTDPAEVTVRLLEPGSERVLAEHRAGSRAAGDASAQLSSADVREAVPAGEYVVEVTARSHHGSAQRADRVARSRTPLALETGFTGAGLGFRGAHPNPFVSGTEFRFALPALATGSVDLEVFDPSGRRIRSLSAPAREGELVIAWDGRDQSGDDPGSGVYLYRVRAAGWERSGKVVRLR
jgi:hypothetical protein